MKDFVKKYRNIFLTIPALIFILVLFFVVKSCNEKSRDSNKFYLDDDFYWAPCNSADEQFSENLEFKKIPELKKYNLSKIADSSGSFIWVKKDFTIPDQLKNQNLGFVIPYLHFAETAWINGIFAGSYGNFPPDEKSAQYQSHFFNLPQHVLNQNGNNTFLMKVYVKGDSSLSDSIFISDVNTAKNYSNNISFFDSKIYMLFIGGMLACFIMFFTMFLMRHQAKESLDFALMNVSTMFFISPIFGSEIPWYTSLGIPHIIFVKVALCCGAYFSAFFTSLFLVDYYRQKANKVFLIIKCFFLAVSIIVTLAMPDYASLMKITPFMIANIIIIVLPGICNVVKKLFLKETRKQSVVLLICFCPTLISMCFDIPLKFVHGQLLGPYSVIFGWQLTIIFFLVVISTNYTRVYKDFEQLNGQLEKAVEKQTEDLTAAKNLMESEKEKLEIELDIASTLQKKIFPPTSANLVGWDLSILFEPLKKVSGDLYDYFEEDFHLNGVTLFDISGHGIAASLITILSKNIVKKDFLRGQTFNDSPTEILAQINDDIVAEKGDVDNYLTGILLKIDPFTKTDECTVHLANGGHPQPILYRAAEEKSEEIVPENTAAQFGAIGIKDFKVSFPTVDFYMSIDDILVLYTDGVTESENSEKVQFGKVRLRSIIKENCTKSASEISKAIRTAISDYMAPLTVQDDITIVVLKRTPSADFIEEL